MKIAKNIRVDAEFTIDELSVIYTLVKESKESLPESEEDGYPDYYGEYIEPASKRVIASILKKISKYLPKEKTNGIDKDFLRTKYHTFNNNINQKVYGILKRAFDQLKTVEIEYFNMESAEFKKRMVDIYYTSAKYTIGYCHLRKDIRKFRTSRIASAKLTNAGYTVPKRFDKNDW